MSNYEPRLTIKDWKAKIYPNVQKPPCDRTIKRWIESGKIRGGATPQWFVYEDWEPRHGEIAMTAKQARLLDKMAG